MFLLIIFLAGNWKINQECHWMGLSAILRQLQLVLQHHRCATSKCGPCRCHQGSLLGDWSWTSQHWCYILFSIDLKAQKDALLSLKNNQLFIWFFGTYLLIFSLCRNLWSLLFQMCRLPIWLSLLVTLHVPSLSASSTIAGAGTWKLDLWVLIKYVKQSAAPFKNTIVWLSKGEVISLYVCFLVSLIPIYSSLHASFYCRTT